MRARGDAAASDMVGTVLLVGLVVALGGLVAVLVSHAIEAPPAPRAAFSLAASAPGASSASLLYRNGPSLPLAQVSLMLSRNASAAVFVPRASWVVPNASRLAPGDSISFALSPVVGTGERIEVRVVDAQSNSILASLARTSGVSSASFSATSLSASAASSLAADGTSGVLLTVRASQPAGALGVAHIVADLSSISTSAGVAPILLDLADDGSGADVQGGDGIWSALLVAPARAPGGLYDIPINATDASGAPSGSTSLTLTLFNANGLSATTGSRFRIPTSPNVTSFRLENFTIDKLHASRVAGDALSLRLVNSTRSWSAVLTFSYANCGGAGNVACVASMDIWNDLNETTYAPRNNSNGIPLAGLSLDLLHPVSSLQWTASGSADPTALYPASNVLGAPTLLVTWLGEMNTKSSAGGPLDAGVLSVDIMVA